MITGLLLFSSNAVAYYENGAFRLKLVLMMLAAVNMLYFELVTFRTVAAWEAARSRLSRRASPGVSRWRCGAV